MRARRRRAVATVAGLVVVLLAAAVGPWSRTGGAKPRRAANVATRATAGTTATPPAAHRATATTTTTPGGAAAPVAPTRARRDPMSIAPQKQSYHNDCEMTALSMLLQTAGVRRSQNQLLRRLPRSRPADPRTKPDGTVVWGDPDRGFVGRIDGGGTAGGYGVYTAPVLALARRYVPAEDLSRRPLSTLLSRLRHGRAVLAWVGLSAGPYRQWVTPRGRRITANLGEHVLLLVGYRGGSIIVDDPLSGAQSAIAPADFSAIWQRLGRRAISA